METQKRPTTPRKRSVCILQGERPLGQQTVLKRSKRHKYCLLEKVKTRTCRPRTELGDSLIPVHSRVPYAPARKRLINKIKGTNNLCPSWADSIVENRTASDFSTVSVIGRRIPDLSK